jgi:hypothetical protein
MRVQQLAFPYDRNSKVDFLERSHYLCIAFDIPRELRLPKSPIALGHGRPRTPGVTMPKTSVDENGKPSSPIREIWRSR